MSVPAVLGPITRADLAVLHAVAAVRTAWLTRLMLDVNAPASPWTVRLLAFGTIAVLAAYRHFRHLAAYLVIFLAALLVSAMTLEIGRMRPTGIEILGSGQGYAQPSRPVATPALALVGALYTLMPAGRWRNLGKWAAGIILAAFCAARLYLAVDHPIDQLTALIIGTLALSSTPEHVYERALGVFAAGDIAEAFAACRSITVPSQSRSLIRTDGRDLTRSFRRLAPRDAPYRSSSGTSSVPQSPRACSRPSRRRWPCSAST